MTPSEAAAYELKQLEKQAEHINRNTLVCVVEDNLIKRVGNMLCPECLWIDFELGIDNLDILRGLPKVIIFPKSEESAKRWAKLNVGRVMSVISCPNDLVDACICS